MGGLHYYIENRGVIFGDFLLIFKNFHLPRFFCDHIHGLHLCDNFGVFNINIEDFMDKNSEKITKNYPSFSYIKVKTPKIELVISTERSWILTFRKKRWNHSNEFFKISLTSFLTPDTLYRLSTSTVEKSSCSDCVNLKITKKLEMRGTNFIARLIKKW